MRASIALTTFIVVVSRAVRVDAAVGSWSRARATYFDAPDAWKKTFAKQIFGDLYGNACGFVNKGEGLESNENLPYARDAVAAVADFDLKLHEGACGSCFEVRCVAGFVLKDFSGGRIEYSRERGFWEVDPDALDSYGRKVPARPAKRDNATSTEYEFVRCWDESLVIKVKIIDTCPCDYEYGTQEICCGPVPHFDLSFYAFEKLAHPIQGKMNIEFRPVSCGEDSRRLDVDLGARARVEAKIYDGGLGAGWALLPYRDRWLVINREGYGRMESSSALCGEFSPRGRVAFHCWLCETSAKPFANVSSVSVWIRISCTDNFDVSLIIGLSHRTRKQWRNGTVLTPAVETQVGRKFRLDPGSSSSDYEIDAQCGRSFVVPIDAFRASSSDLARVNTLAIEVPSDVSDPVSFCVDALRARS